MKKTLTLLTTALAAAMLLTACGGGGGGGSGSSTTRPPAYLAEAEANFGVGSKVVPVDTPIANSGFGVTKTPDGLILSGSDVGSRRVTVTAADFGDDPTNPADFLTAEKTSSGRYSSNPAYSYTATDTVMLGGKKLGLSHADFGLWAAQENVTETATGDPRGKADTFTPFTMGDPSKKAAFAGSGSQAFTGTTVAVAHGGGQSGVDQLTGTAALTVNLNNLNSSNLNLDLNNFAEFAIPVAISASGGIVATGAVATVSNRSTNRDLTTPYASVSGQFYGDSPNAPSEGVGSYLIQSSSGQYTSINGSFGVKR